MPENAALTVLRRALTKTQDPVELREIGAAIRLIKDTTRLEAWRARRGAEIAEILRETP